MKRFRLPSGLPTCAMADIARYTERGFDGIWQAESRLVRDAIVPMAAYAAVTEKFISVRV